VIDNDVKFTCFAWQTKIMDVDDNDEYINAAAAHASFVMTVSVSTYWSLHHAQHARDINIHKLHLFHEKNQLGPLCRL